VRSFDLPLLLVRHALFLDQTESETAVRQVFDLLFQARLSVDRLIKEINICLRNPISAIENGNRLCGQYGDSIQGFRVLIDNLILFRRNRLRIPCEQRRPSFFVPRLSQV